MNRDMILRVADAIEEAAKPEAKPTLGFNMETYYNSNADEYAPDLTGHRCGTTACIAGWAMAINGDSLSKIDLLSNSGAIRRGAEILGIEFESATSLFTIPDDALALSNVTPNQAVTVLRHLAKTGEVDWSVAEGV